MEAFAIGIGDDYPKGLKRIRLLEDTDKLIIEGVRLIDGTGAQPKEKVSVVIEKGKIRSVQQTELTSDQRRGAEIILL